ncbi:MAG: cytochrome c biogenesis protein CcsA [Bacillota bacterium]|nr:cytochrome c biogenesis protein CcsA [Bacillota bacterium]
MKRLRGLGWLAYLTVGTALLLAFLYAPPEAVMGEMVRFLYFHVGSAWVAFLAFGITALASILFLWQRRFLYDQWAAASAEIGVLFTAITLITGMFWARAVWNVWWRWEPRLTTTLILWFIFVAYLLIRSAIEDRQRRGVVAAVVGLVGFANVPLVYLASRLWGGFHPAGAHLEGRMVVALLVSVLAFTVLYGYLFLLALRVRRLEERTHHLYWGGDSF